MGADAARFVPAARYERPRRSRAGLALTLAPILALHLLAAWMWQQHQQQHQQQRQHQQRVHLEDRPGVVTILLRLADPGRVRTPPEPPPAPRPGERFRALRAPAFAPTRAPGASQALEPPERTPAADTPPTAASDAAPMPAPTLSPTAPQDAPTAGAAPPASASGDAPASDAAPGAPAGSIDGGFLTSLSRRQAGRIDRELRGGKSAVPVEADTPWARFQRGLEAAHVDRSMSARLDSYTSPDGVVIYRRRVGGRTTCYRTGSVGLGIAGARGVNDAGPVPCPAGVTWTREE